ncbi:hypothetical protein D9M72_543520 [compost metagenome]
MASQPMLSRCIEIFALVMFGIVLQTLARLLDYWVISQCIPLNSAYLMHLSGICADIENNLAWLTGWLKEGIPEVKCPAAY